MTNIPHFNNKGTQSTNILITFNHQSLLQCAAFCKDNVHCKSILYSPEKMSCQLLAVLLGSGYILNVPYIENTETVLTAEISMTTPFDCSIWHAFNGHRYKLDNTFRTFESSQNFCASLFPSSYVMEVESQDENDWVVTFTATQCGEPKEYWLNAYDTNDSVSFTWLQSKATTTYTNWHSDQPSNPSEECIVSSTRYLGVWVDIACTQQRPVVCERDV
ncbi:snaclec coagulation factor IX-binding protein subunit A-like [Saccostrea echinata]|uniref:snaclec coagulation factor IX-binding protein subunit A-like n=1 Tax=Saccostrea echinata TaxID=191078 RepID=UPI002A7FE12E|nr:snaclec coagulation factor IX-binding protein subunit A-like [Saccostrea echinata]